MFEEATFFRAVHHVDDLPPDTGVEVAFAGRSNAGKSTALNVLLNRKSLARVSKTPGRTRAINFFKIGPDCFIVDLPGYGYASVSKRERSGWGTLISAYIQHRNALRGLVVVMDARHPLGKLDQGLLGWISEMSIPAHVLLTKSDKLSRGESIATLNNCRAALSRTFPGCSAQLFSGLDKTGVKEARALLAAWLNKKPPVKGE